MKARTERLSREAIVDSAIALADAEGLDAVTIRRLAHDRGVTPMALYWHFKDKDRLLDGLAERLYSEVELPDPDAPGAWHERLRTVLESLLAAIRRHPALSPLAMPRIMASEPGLEISERALGLLREGGYSAAQASQLGSQVLCMIVLMVDAVPGQEIGVPAAEAEQSTRRKKAALESLDPRRYPNVVDFADCLTSPGDLDDWFDTGMELLFAGLRGLRPAGPPA